MGFPWRFCGPWCLCFVSGRGRRGHCVFTDVHTGQDFAYPVKLGAACFQTPVDQLSFDDLAVE